MSDRTLRRYSPRSNAACAVHKPRAFAANALDGGIIAAFSILAGIGLVMIYSLTAPLAATSAMPPQFIRQLVTLATSILVLIAALRVPRRCVASTRTTALGNFECSVARDPGRRDRSQRSPALARTTRTAPTSRRGREVRNGSRRCGAADRDPFASSAPEARGPRGRALRSTGRAPLDATGFRQLPRPVCGGRSPALRGGHSDAIAGPAYRSSRSGEPAVYVALNPYAHARWIGFLNPWETATREGFQLVQSFVAFGRGGPFRSRGRRRATETLLPARGPHGLHPRRYCGRTRHHRRSGRTRRVCRVRLGGRANRPTRPGTARSAGRDRDDVPDRNSGGRQRGRGNGVASDHGLHPALRLLRR